MTIDSFMSDVEPFSIGKPLQLAADGIPGETGYCVGII
jgi:hypothetical protein